MSVLNKKVLKFAEQSIGRRVFAAIKGSGGTEKSGDGICWDLAFEALRQSNAKTPHDFGKIYKWSNKTVLLNAAKPGDIIQYKSLRIKVTFMETVKKRIVSNRWETYEIGQPHHTAIIKSIGSNGYVTVIEQNMNNKKGTHVNSYYLKTTTFEKGTIKTIIEVNGRFKIYRPEVKR